MYMMLGEPYRYRSSSYAITAVAVPYLVCVMNVTLNEYSDGTGRSSYCPVRPYTSMITLYSM